MKSLYVRLSVVFLVLIVAMTIVIGWSSIRSANRFVDETEQKLNMDLAASLAADFQPFLIDSIDTEAIQKQIEYFIGINPKIDIYLLGNTGMIKALFVPSGREPIMRAMDTEPLDRFLRGDKYPIWGQDPLSETGMKPFSVAPLEIMGEQGCYLYIVLGSDQFDTTSAMIQDSYILKSLVLNVGLVLLFTMVVGLILFGVITKRIQKIVDGVQSFGRGDYSNRIQLTGADEIASLARTVDTMADTIEDNIKRLESTDSLRRELVANISHDLRSPLSSVRGHLETILMKADDLTREQILSYVETGLAGTDRLNRLVEALFELSKLDANQVTLNPEPFSVGDLIQDVVHQFQPKAKSAGVELVFSLEEDPSLAFGDIGLVERALTNLVENAIKYTPKGGQVRVESKWGPGSVELKIADSGRGISDTDLPFIFDRFYQVDKSRNPISGGTGLGLAITKKIIELHNSTLSVSSKLNVGTSFSFLLPVSSPVVGNAY
ncbi:HAMP domain-containing protein [bacterium]|nr:HAMP domain-containing protein [bacterium]